jgi:hypothetical protein
MQSVFKHPNERDHSSETTDRIKQEKSTRKSFVAPKDKNAFYQLLEFFEPLSKSKKKK